jgi:hypothetical protein
MRVFCKPRFLHHTKTNFYSNERQLHGSSSNPATAHVCGEFFNVIVLRDPVQHAQSLLLNTYINTLDFIKKRLFQPWIIGFTLPNEFEVWRRMAPAVVNNYYTRTLLGKWVALAVRLRVMDSRSAGCRRPGAWLQQQCFF